MKKIILLIILILPTAVQAQDTELQDMVEMTAIVNTDVLYVVDDPAGAPASRYITALNLFDMIDTFAELNAIVVGTTLVNEESVVTWDALITFDLGLTITTGDPLTFGVNRIDDGADLLNGEMIGADTIDNDSIDWGDMTDLDTDGQVLWGNITAGELADDTVNDADINWADIANLGAGGAVTLSATVTTADDDVDNDNQEIVFTTTPVGAAALETDTDFHYNPSTGTVTATNITIDGVLLVQDATLETTASYHGVEIGTTKTGGVTDAADYMEGIRSSITINHNGGTVGETAGAFLKSILADGTVGDGDDFLLGATASSQITGGTASSDMGGVRSYVDLDAGTVSGNVYGFNMTIDAEAAMTAITGNIYGGYIDIDDDQGAGGTVYGLYLNENTGVDYGVYQNGSAANYLGGALDVIGALTEGGNAVYSSGETPSGSLGGTYANITIDDLFIKLAGDVATAGDYDFGEANVDLELPQTSPATPDVDGQVEVDFTDGKVVIQHSSGHAELGASTDVVVGTLIKSWSGTIFEPDGVNDVLTVKAINSIEFPHGVVITAVYLGVSSDDGYVLTVQNFDDFDTINVANPTIDTVTYPADATGEVIDTTPTYATIAAGQIIMISIPATDVDWIHFEIYYYEPAA